MLLFYSLKYTARIYTGDEVGKGGRGEGSWKGDSLEY